MRSKEEIFEMIEEEDIEFIRLQFTDIMGNLKNIAVTPGQFERVTENMHSFEGSALFDDVYEYPDDLYLRPDLDSFVILPWRPQQGKVAKVVCDIYTEDGEPLDVCSRRILKNVLDKAEEKGYSFLVDPECEFFLFHTDENGLPTTISHEKAGFLDVGPVDFGENARRDIVLMLEEMGFDVEASYHEHASAQHEIDFRELEALDMADAIQTFRFAVRSVAKRFGLYATFMPMPKPGKSGSSMHTSFIVLKDGRNVLRGSDGQPSEEAYYFMGGLLKHGRALTAFGNPIVNSYKRLLASYGAPERISWTKKGRKSFLKLKKANGDVKIKVRFPDGACNPYLMMASCIVAGLDGIENKIDPGEDWFGKDKNQYEELPGTLKEAIDALEADELIKEAMGTEFTEIYASVKNAEWKEFMTAVSEWEFNRYLTRI